MTVGYVYISCVVCRLDTIIQIESLNSIPYSQKFLRYVYFAVKSLIRIFPDKILRMAYNEASFQLKMMLSSEFPLTKFSLLIDHLRKPRKFHTAKISSYTVLLIIMSTENGTILCRIQKTCLLCS